VSSESLLVTLPEIEAEVEAVIGATPEEQKRTLPTISEMV
jgi:hypothetical protein